MDSCAHTGPCKQLLAIGKRGPAFEPWRRTRVWFQHPRLLTAGKLVKSVRFVAGAGGRS